MAKKQLPPIPAGNGAYIKFQVYDHVFIPVEKATEFLACLDGAYVMGQNYVDGSYVYELKDKQEFSFDLVQGYEITNAIAAKKLEV